MTEPAAAPPAPPYDDLWRPDHWRDHAGGEPLDAFFVGVVAFGVPDENAGTARLVVVAEAATVLPDNDARERMEGAVIRAIAEGTGVPPDVVEIVPPRAVPKTSSG